MMAYTGRLRPESRWGGGGTQQIIVRGGSALRSNPVPSRKRYIFVTDSCFMTAHFQQLRGIQSSKQGM